jgi:hypothetical protein
LEIPEDAVGRLEYYIEAFDTSGNPVRSDTITIPIHDRIDPAISKLEDITTYVGLRVFAEVDVDDNIGVGPVLWSGFGDIHEGTSWEGSFSEEGIYDIQITVSDLSNNTASTSFRIEVLSELHDGDGDGLPDLFELDHGLSPDDPEDALLDLDMDGLSNLKEYSIGTKLRSADTDNDGMDDGWETGYGLDPLTFSAYLDTDGDGSYDLEEYISGTDPLVFNEQGSGDDNVYLMVVLTFLIAGIISVLLVMIGKRIRSRKIW